MVGDKLYINNQKFTKDTMHSLPERLQPQRIFTKSKDNMTAFFTRNSPLSNHFPSPFKINGESFGCLEQYMMVEKARTFGDQEAEVKIMHETSPIRQKQAGKNIKGFKRDIWEQAAEEKVLPGLLAKFQQNQVCKELLLSTNNNSIIEANSNDSFFGAGISLRSPDLWNTSVHPGKNVMGKMLQQVRARLRDA